VTDYELDFRGYIIILLYHVQTSSGAHQVPYPMGTAAGSVKLTTHIHLVPRLRIRRALPPLLLYAFMAWHLGVGTSFLHFSTII